MSTFDYTKFDASSQETQAVFKKAFENIEAEAIYRLGKSRAASLVMTKLEEAYMWVGKAIRDAQKNREENPLPEVK